MNPRWAGLALLLVATSAAAPGCLFLAPGPVGGTPQGGACSADLDCDDGLECACGTCVAWGANEPPGCEISIDDRCQDPPATCFESCGSTAELGPATCVNGRESCAEAGGVLMEDCPAGTCWGESRPGEVCVDGNWECGFGENPITGLCYTFDCEGERVGCVLDCDDAPTLQICLGDEWTCEIGAPVEEVCGVCGAQPPSCVDSCEEQNVLGAAACDEGAEDWSCDWIAGAVRLDECCAVGATVDTAEELAVYADATCVVGSLVVVDLEEPLIELPSLVRAGTLRFEGNDATRISLPSLRRVDADFIVVSNPALSVIEVPELTEVYETFEISFNASFPECEAEAILARLVTSPSPVFITNNDDDATCGPDGGVLDGGAPDAGLTDGGPDGGLHDGGVADGGPAADGGPEDGGAQSGDAGPDEDAGGPDAGGPDDGGASVTDAGPADAGDGGGS